MTNFDNRYQNLNAAQRQAVDTIDGPLLVIAGPGTGKTELLSMRAANILRKTDTLPSSVLCLTYTDSGANAMRARLADIIGPDAYKVVIHTFHSFGTEIINQYNEYFYHGANFKPADELSQFEVLTAIFDELDYSNPLASKRGDEYIHLKASMSTISELKRAGLTSDELLHLIDTNEIVIDAIERQLTEVFAGKIHISMLEKLAPIAQQVADLPTANLPSGITPLGNALALSLAHAIDAASETNKTTTITAWRNQWLEKDLLGNFVFKDRKRYIKLRAISHIYYAYLSRMEQAGLYDFDDMILNVIQALEKHSDLRFNLQEKYQYIMVDEFQDTNLAQLRILFDLTDAPNTNVPNIMAVGDDDQAIFSFQGADVNNIHRFASQYKNFTSIVLTDNYRSSEIILKTARQVIVQGDGRLEDTMNLDKNLTPHFEDQSSGAKLYQLESSDAEKLWLANDIQKLIAAGVSASSITVIARRHDELVQLVPYLFEKSIPVSYERRDNVLEFPAIQTLIQLAGVIVSIGQGEHDDANEALPELLSHPMFAIEPETIWRLSLTSHRNHLSWLEIMITNNQLKPIADWLINEAARIAHDPVETIIDRIIGVPSETIGDEIIGFRSPFYEYYFGDKAREADPEQYLATLEALRTVRDRLREYHPNDNLYLSDFLHFIALNQAYGARITTVRRNSSTEAAVNLMTAHKSKGLEYDHVYIIGAIDSNWGQQVRSPSRLISYPANLQIAPSGGSYDERLRLFFVAMTRAKQQLSISFACSDSKGKPQLPASFLTGTAIETIAILPDDSLVDKEHAASLAWQDRLANLPAATMQQLLAPTLADYRLSATHLNNFIDLSRGGPKYFLFNNLLKFPQAKSPHASYGTAVHSTLQKAHNHLTATGEKRAIEDILGDFVNELRTHHLPVDDEALFVKKGTDSLNAFLKVCYQDFRIGQKTELNFSRQGVVIEDAILSGSLDVVEISDNSLVVTDYKTGRPAADWKGRDDREKIKLHKYRQQLMFYQLLCQNSRDYSKYNFERAVLQFVEPDMAGRIHALDAQFSSEELTDFKKLIGAVWQCITKLDFPDVSEFEPTYKGIVSFEKFLVDNYSK